MPHTFAASLVILLLAVQIGAAGVDPLVWIKPDQAPAFRDLVPADEFRQRSREILQSLGGLKALGASPVPDHGIRYLAHVGDSQVAGWNLQPGDLITKAEPYDLWGGPFPNDERRKVTIYEMNRGRSRTVVAKAEPFSIVFGTHWRPELAYLRAKNLRNPRWDEFVVVGSTCRESDPDLAESAWFRALEAGYPRDGLTEICGALIALQQGRPDIAADFAYLARAAEPKIAKFVSPVALLRVMLANYKLDDAFELCQRYPKQLTSEPRIFRALADVHRSRPEAERIAAAPSQLAEQRYRDDLLDRCLPLTTFARNDLPKLRERNGLSMSLDNGIHIPWAFSPPAGVRDFEATIRFSVSEITPGPDEGRMEVALFPPTPENLHLAILNLEQSVIQIDAISESRIIFKHGHASYGTPFESPDFPISLQRTQEIRVIRVAGQAEIWINGHRALYQPLPLLENESLAIMIRPVSVTVRFESFEFHELLKKQ